MAQPTFRGVRANQEVEASRILRQHKLTSELISEWLRTPLGLATAMATAAALPFMAPSLTLPTAAVGMVIYLAKRNAATTTHLPIRQPKYYRRWQWVKKKGQRFSRFRYDVAPDFGDQKPGRAGFFSSSGIFYLGNSFDSKMQELWLSARDLLTHMLIFGTTGAGKTEAMLSLATNFLTVGSGYIYVDPKAAPKLIAQNFYAARMFGREDDVYVVNFLSATEAFGVSTPIRRGNTMNPVATATAESAAQMIASLIEVSKGDNAVFGQAALSLISAILFGAADLRDKGKLRLSIPQLRRFLNPQACIELAKSKDISERARESLMGFLLDKGYKEGDKQTDQFMAQFGYASSYFTRAMALLADSYTNIFAVHRGEVDMGDAVANRRIVIVAIPSLTLSPADCSNIGKVVLSQVKFAAGLGLGDNIQGTVDEIIDGLPTNSRSAVGVFTDEYAAIVLDGYVQVATQARGLGLCGIFGSQDYAGVSRANEAEGEQLAANTRAKVIMSQEDAQKTWQLVQAMAGEADVLSSSGSHIDGGASMGLDYIDRLEAQYGRRSRVDLRDLSEQLEGEAHVFTRGKLERARMFHADPMPPSDFPVMANQFLELDDPDRMDLDARVGDTRRIVDDILLFLEQDRSWDKEDRDIIEQAGSPSIEEEPVAFPLLKALLLVRQAREDMPHFTIGYKEAGVAVFLWTHQQSERAFGGLFDTLRAQLQGGGDARPLSPASTTTPTPAPPDAPAPNDNFAPAPGAPPLPSSTSFTDSTPPPPTPFKPSAQEAPPGPATQPNTPSHDAEEEDPTASSIAEHMPDPLDEIPPIGSWADQDPEDDEEDRESARVVDTTIAAVVEQATRNANRRNAAYAAAIAATRASPDGKVPRLGVLMGGWAESAPPPDPDTDRIVDERDDDPEDQSERPHTSIASAAPSGIGDWTHRETAEIVQAPKARFVKEVASVEAATGRTGPEAIDRAVECANSIDDIIGQHVRAVEAITKRPNESDDI